MLNMTGLEFGFLRVVGRAKDRVSTSGRKEVMWLCECACGNQKIVRGTSLRKGNTVSCGCYRNSSSSIRMSARKKHGLAGTRIYKLWKMMISRCENKNNKSYKNYGALGIDVCEEWHDVATFVDWALENGYSDELTIERLNNTIGYSPDNCTWANRVEQNNHTSRNHMITYLGRTQTMAQWCRELDLSYGAVKARVNKYGWQAERALSTPTK